MKNDTTVTDGIVEENISASAGAAEYPKSKVKSTAIKRIAIPLLCFIAGMIAVTVVCSVRMHISDSNAKKELRKELMRDWEAAETTEGVSIIWVLDFSEDKVAYRAVTGYSTLDRTLAEYDYKVTGANSFGINRFGNEWEQINVYFSEDGAVMFISPSFTDGENAAVWFATDGGTEEDAE
ncbi:MAG: hypothetical protein E7583_02400 [Ruminococcaceae bacterium]|nr:hypothetical protein [Oscillospiraceae bacterium]